MTPANLDDLSPARMARLTHDLNNYLTVIGGYALLLAETLPPGEQREWVQQVRSAAAGAGSAVGELQSLGQARAPLTGR